MYRIIKITMLIMILLLFIDPGKLTLIILFHVYYALYNSIFLCTKSHNKIV